MTPPQSGMSVVDDDEPTDAKERALAIAERMIRLTALEERLDEHEARLAALEAKRVPPDVALLNRMRDEREDRSQR